jgi:hypothetical protein
MNTKFRLLLPLLGLAAACGTTDDGVIAPASPNKAKNSEFVEAENLLTGAELRGRSRTFNSDDGNRCADDVEAAFTALPNSPSGKIRYRSRGGATLPPDNAKLEPFGSFEYHVQSITRFAPGLDGDARWLAVSRSHKHNRAGFLLVNLNDAAGVDGSTLLEPGKSYPSDPVPTGRETQFYYPIKDTGHPGGMFAFGKYLAVASESETRPSWVDIYDFSEGPGSGIHLQRVMVTSQGRDFEVARVIGGVAVNPLSDGRFLMFVLGQDKKKEGWFYISDSDRLTTETEWTAISRVGDSNWDEYQNVSMVSECNTGNLYVIATGNASYASDLLPGSNVADLFLVSGSDESVNMTKRVSRVMADVSDGFCTFRAGANAYVDADGKLAMYCHAHHANTDIIDGPDSKLKMVEFASSGCLEAQTACGDTCCSEGSSCVDGSCCPVANSCGSSCCGAGSECRDPSLGLCCDALSIQCGGACCTFGDECIDGACVPPPPPPPPPPAPEEGTCAPFEECSTAADCPGGQFCQGGCCFVLR